MLQKENVPDVIKKREDWKKTINTYDTEHLVFLDESGVNVNMNRIYGRAIGGKRTEDTIPLNTPQNTTMLSSIRLNGEIAYTIYQGGTKKDKFIEYIRDILIPTLYKDDIVIMDNMRTHHCKEVQDILENAGIKFLYLPPYSPDLTPIEKMWSKVKADLRKQKERNISLLANAIHKAISTVTSSDCIGWFRSCCLSC